MKEEKKPHVKNLKKGGKHQWWTMSRHCVYLRKIKILRESGLTWNEVISELGMSTSPAVLSVFYRRNYGKVTPFHLKILDKRGVPGIRSKPANWEHITNIVWMRLQDGIHPQAACDLLDQHGWHSSQRTKREFMRCWIRNVAVEVWEKSEEEILAVRKKRERKKRK